MITIVILSNHKKRCYSVQLRGSSATKKGKNKMIGLAGLE